MKTAIVLDAYLAAYTGHRMPFDDEGLPGLAAFAIGRHDRQQNRKPRHLPDLLDEVQRLLGELAEKHEENKVREVGFEIGAHEDKAARVTALSRQIQLLIQGLPRERRPYTLRDVPDVSGTSISDLLTDLVPFFIEALGESDRAAYASLMGGPWYPSIAEEAEALIRGETHPTRPNRAVELLALYAHHDAARPAPLTEAEGCAWWALAYEKWMNTASDKRPESEVIGSLIARASAGEVPTEVRAPKTSTTKEGVNPRRTSNEGIEITHSNAWPLCIDCVTEQQEQRIPTVLVPGEGPCAVCGAGGLMYTSVERRFNELASAWQLATGGSSSPWERVAHPAYQGIVSLGWPVVPFLLKKLRDEDPDFWGAALQEITNERISIAPENAGKNRAAADAWLELAKKRGWKQHD